MIYWQLFLSFVQIGLFSFGGGYAALPLIQQQTVAIHDWITMETFADLLTISEMTPGPIAINSATFVGLQVAGLPGALVATLGIVLPSCFIVSFLAWLYRKYRSLQIVHDILGCVRPAAVAMIASACMGVLITALWPLGMAGGWLQSIDWIAVGIFVIALILLRWRKPNPILIIGGSAAVGAVMYFLGIR